MGVIFKNENVNEEMLAILKQFHTYLPKRADGSCDPQLLTGDQLMSSLQFQTDTQLKTSLKLGDWHAGVKIVSVSLSNGRAI